MDRPELPPVGTPEFRAAREAAMANCRAPLDYVLSDPVGFAEGMRVSCRIVSNYRKHHRDSSLDVQPQEVIAALESAGIENWVLMGLYGYVGYLADPRATQDVNVLVGSEEQAATVAAMKDRWPSLIVRETEVVIRFLDPGEKDKQGRPKPVIDVMLPWSHLHQEILRSEVVVDPQAEVRHPTLEAAIAAKYAAMVSPNRQFSKKVKILSTSAIS